MDGPWSDRTRSFRCLIVLSVILLGVVPPVAAGPIDLGTWYQFSFTDAGLGATGCDPADPAGAFCIPSSGTPTTILDGPPWTLLAPAGATLTVTDAFEAGDQFEVFDFGISLGLTSLPSGSDDCGDDPVPCLADPDISKGLFPLGPGAHSLTVTPTLSPSGGGSGFLRVDGARIPEPAAVLLIGAGLVTLWWRRARRWRNQANGSS